MLVILIGLVAEMSTVSGTPPTNTSRLDLTTVDANSGRLAGIISGVLIFFAITIGVVSFTTQFSYCIRLLKHWMINNGSFHTNGVLYATFN